MGEIASIAIGSYDFMSYKNTFGDLLLPFSASDRRVSEYFEDGEFFSKFLYATTVARAKLCLDTLGYTIENAEKEFDDAKARELEYLKENDEPVEAHSTEFTFSTWRYAATKAAYLLSIDTFDHSNCEYVSLEQERNSGDSSVAKKVVFDALPFEEPYFGFPGAEYSFLISVTDANNIPDNTCSFYCVLPHLNVSTASKSSSTKQTNVTTPCNRMPSNAWSQML